MTGVQGCALLHEWKQPTLSQWDWVNQAVCLQAAGLRDPEGSPLTVGE